MTTERELEALARNILLTIAYGKPGEDGKRMAQALKEQFSMIDGALDLHESKPSSNPSTAG